MFTTQRPATTFHLLSRNNLFSDPSINITTLSERFESNDVKVTLGLIGESGFLITYNISVVPQVPVRHNNTERDVYRLSVRVPYNTVLNVSVSASMMCGDRITNQYFELYYGQ